MFEEKQIDLYYLGYIQKTFKSKESGEQVTGYTIRFQNPSANNATLEFWANALDFAAKYAHLVPAVYGDKTVKPVKCRLGLRQQKGNLYKLVLLDVVA